MKTHNILSIDKFKSNIGSNSRLLGIDPGGANIGLAICDENKKVATPLKVIKKKKFKSFLAEINEIINENNIKGIIIGNPINMDGSSSQSSQSAKDFAENLSKNIAIPVSMWDERLSSEAGFKLSKEFELNTSNTVKIIDKNAAAFILQGAIDYLSN